MKLIAILTTLAVATIGEFASAQHHHPAATAVTSTNYKVDASNVDLDGVAVAVDEADDTARKLKLHDMLTSVMDIMEKEEFGLTTTAAGDDRRLSIATDNGLYFLLLAIVVLLADFFGYEEYLPLSKSAKSEGSAKSSKDSKSVSLMLN